MSHAMPMPKNKELPFSYRHMQKISPAGVFMKHFIRNGKTEMCSYAHRDDYYIVVVLTAGSASLKIEESSLDCQPSGLCPFMCRWVLKKHGWLINELFELKKYLYSVNNSLISTEINVNIFFRDEYYLDADLIDSVKDYLEKT